MRWLKKYTQSFLLGFETALEYRANFLLSLVSAAYPIFIQTFLWTAIYNASSEGDLYGYTFRQMIAYTFMAGLMLLVLFLTYSRAALGGIIVATMYVATLRYRRLWWAILGGGLLPASYDSS